MTRTPRTLLLSWLAVMLSFALPLTASDDEDESKNPLAALENYRPTFVEGSSYTQLLDLHLSMSFDVPRLSPEAHSLLVQSSERQDVQVVPCAGGACSCDGGLPVQLKSTDGGSHFVVAYDDHIILDRSVQHETERYWTLDEEYEAFEEKFVASSPDFLDVSLFNLPPSPFVCTMGCDGGDCGDCDDGCGDSGGCDLCDECCDSDCDCSECECCALIARDCACDDCDECDCDGLDATEIAEMAALGLREFSRPYMLSAAGVWRYAVMLHLMEGQLQEAISGAPVRFEGEFEAEEGFIAADYSVAAEALPLDSNDVKEFFEQISEFSSLDLISLPADYLDLIKDMTATVDAELEVGGSWYACSGLAYDLSLTLKLELTLFDSEGEPAGSMSMTLAGLADSQPMGWKGPFDDFGLTMAID